MNLTEKEKIMLSSAAEKVKKNCLHIYPEMPEGDAFAREQKALLRPVYPAFAQRQDGRLPNHPESYPPRRSDIHHPAQSR